MERAERDSSKYRCRRYLVWSRYEIIWVKGQTRIFQKKMLPDFNNIFLAYIFRYFYTKNSGSG
jgi:hypothetical protein